MFSVEMLNNFDGQKEVIECADFFALKWKLDGIKVNHFITFFFIPLCSGISLHAF